VQRKEEPPMATADAPKDVEKGVQSPGPATPVAVVERTRSDPTHQLGTERKANFHEGMLFEAESGQ
jgi:hypothetical protein